MYIADVETSMKIHKHVGVDYTSDLDKTRSLTKYLLMFGGNVVSQTARLQPIVDLSTTMEKYITIMRE